MPPWPASTSIFATASTPARCRRASHFIGSTYSTRVSFIDVVMKILGNTATRASSVDSGAFSYGVYPFIYRYTSALCNGSPHSSHSVTVNGNDGSRIDVNASTNGTSASMPA